jgi:hypothetical protein
VRVHGYTAGRIELAAAEGGAAGKTSARVRLWPRRLVTKASGARVMERDGDFELEEDGSFVFEVPRNRRAGAAAAPTRAAGPTTPVRAMLGMTSSRRAPRRLDQALARHAS